jgi:N-acetylglucosaminyldiphosphoundecaprenol N-acetyl-beta-D-mannosaminyltransferase
MVWAGRRAGARWMERVYGPDLMLAICQRAAERGWTSYFYGGKNGIPERLAERLTARYPGLRVVGTMSPPFRSLTPEEDDAAVARINAAAPDLLWVGLSTPKQERWMAGHVGRVRAPVLVGVGAAFDIHAGTLRQAPPWMRKRGLEWFYRLYREPRRLAKRYLSNNPRFVLAIVRRPPRLV